MSDQDQVLRQDSMRTVFLEENYSLYLPYQEEKAVKAAGMVRREWDLVKKLLPKEPETPLIIRFIPYSQATLLKNQNDGHSAGVISFDNPEFGGYAIEPLGIVIVNVLCTSAAQGDISFIISADPEKYAPTVRHELCHIFIHASFPDLPYWINEGVTREIEHLQIDLDEKWAEDPAGIDFALAKKFHRKFSLKEIITMPRLTTNLWSAEGPNKFSERQGNRELIPRTLVRFLLKSAPKGSWAEKIKYLADLSQKTILQQDAQFRAWLDSCDLLDSVEQLAANSKNYNKACSLLLFMGSLDLPECHSERADRIALSLLHQEENFFVGDFFLLYRAKEMSTERVQDFVQSEKPELQLLGFAIQALRGETVDAASKEKLGKFFAHKFPPPRAWRVLFPDSNDSK